MFGGYTYLDPVVIDGGNQALTALATGTRAAQLIYNDRQFGGNADNRTVTQTAAGVVTITSATKLILREVPSYWRFDAPASIDLTYHVTLSVNARNLTDKGHFSQAYASY